MFAFGVATALATKNPLAIGAAVAMVLIGIALIGTAGTETPPGFASWAVTGSGVAPGVGWAISRLGAPLARAIMTDVSQLNLSQFEGEAGNAVGLAAIYSLVVAVYIAEVDQ